MATDNVVNGVTKQFRDNTYRYLFANAFIIADNANNRITYNIISPAISNETIDFDDITDKKGATTPEEYVDQLATDGLFFLVESSEGTITGTVSVDNFPDPQNVNVQQGGQDLSQTNPLPIGIQPQLSAVYTAFGRLRTAQEQKKLEISAIDGKQPLFINEELNLFATSTAANSVVTMETNDLGDYVIRQTKQRAVYQKGNSQLVLITFDSMQAQTGIEKRVGYFTSNQVAPFQSNRDGFFLETSGGETYIVLAKNGSETKIAQANWNIDTFDGSGVSGITIDLSQRNIFVGSLEWLGVGIVVCGFNVDGITYAAHAFFNANNGTGVYMLTGSKPLRWEIYQTQTLVAGTLTQICGSVASEGAQNQLGKIRSADVEDIQANSTSTIYPLVGMKIQSGKDYCQIDLKRISLLATTNDNYIIYVYFNPTLSGTPTFNPESESVIETASGSGLTVTSATTVIGILHGVGNLAAPFDIPSELRLGTNIDGTRDEIWLAVKPLTSNLDIYGSITWQEQI